MDNISITLYSLDRGSSIYSINGVPADPEIWWSSVKLGIISQPGCLKVDNKEFLIYAIKYQTK